MASVSASEPPWNLVKVHKLQLTAWYLPKIVDAEPCIKPGSMAKPCQRRVSTLPPWMELFQKHPTPWLL